MVLQDAIPLLICIMLEKSVCLRNLIKHPTRIALLGGIGKDKLLKTDEIAAAQKFLFKLCITMERKEKIMLKPGYEYIRTLKQKHLYRCLLIEIPSGNVYYVHIFKYSTGFVLMKLILTKYLH